MSIVLRDGAHRFVAMCKRNDYRASFYDFTPPQPFFHHGHFRVQHIDVVHVVSVGTGQNLDFESDVMSLRIVIEIES